MSEFGWAYVVGTQTQGPSGSLQATTAGGRLSGSQNLIYDADDGVLTLTGSLNISGALNVNEINLNVTNRNVVNLSSTGSTRFGDDCSDRHVFTGSMLISCSSTPLNIIGIPSGAASSSNHYLALDSNYNLVLTSAVADAGGLIDEYTNSGNNRIITSIDSSGINAEQNLLFDGTTMTVTGDISSSVGVSSSVGQFTNLTGAAIKGTTVNATTVTANSLGGTLSTAAQPNVTSLGTLTSLNVSGDLSASALFVSSSNERVGIGTNSPAKKIEVLDTSEQLRLSYSKYIFGISSDVFTDVYTNNSGDLIIDPSNDRVGIGTASPTKTLDVNGDVRIAGNLEVTGALSARVSEFIVSANNITFGDAATDSLTFNASSGTVPNGLNLDSNTWVLDSANNRIGIGVEHPDALLDIKSNGSAGNEVLRFSLDGDRDWSFAQEGAGAGTGLRLRSLAAKDFHIDATAVIYRDHNGSNEIMRVESTNGKVGIGTSTPETKLHVSGTTSITQDLGVTGSITGSTLTDGTVKITGGDISSVGTLTATNVNATSLGGTLSTAAQPNVTSLGTLTSLTVGGDVTVDTNTFKVNSTSNKVGIGRVDPEKKLDVLDTDRQLRLTHTKASLGVSAVHSDLYTTGQGYLILSGTAQRVGIGTESPSRMLDVDGNVRIGGNLEITGSLHAKVSEFIVTADNITFGQDAEDTLIFNAASGTIMNGLNWDNDTFVMDSDNNRIGVGVAHPDTKLHVKTTSSQLKLAYNDSASSTFTVKSNGDLSILPTGNFLTASSGFKVSGSTILGSLPTQHTVVSGHLTASIAVSSSLGRFTKLTASSMTDGTALINGGNITNVGTLSATNLGGTLSTAAQPNITSVGTLADLTISGDLSVDTKTLKVDSVNDRVGIGRNDPQKTLEVLDTGKQFRVSYSKYIFGVSANVFSDLSTDSSGFLVLSGSGGKTKIDNGLQVTGLLAGTGITTKYLALDSSNNIILTSSVTPGIETRARRKITGNSTLAVDDYYIGVSASSDVTLTLLDASTIPNGQTFTIKDERGNANSIEIKIVASGSQVIDGESFVIIESPFGALNLYTDGVSKYFIF